GGKTNDPKLFIKKINNFILNLFGRDNFKDQNISEDLIDGFIERVLLDKGLPEISPVDINSESLQKIFKEILYT
ncbi:MAG: hypothetical protein J7J33_04535, partial [Caldisericia bacterium]|nr:hypothetical protein [Caldisericia bacterium]